MHLKIVLQGSFFLVFLGKKCPWKNSENDDVKLFLTDRSHHKMAKENVKTFFWYYFMSELEEPRSTDLSFEHLAMYNFSQYFFFKVTFMFC